MSHLVTKKNMLISALITLIVMSPVKAAEFVVQTDLDVGGGTVIAEISPDVYTIDTLRSAVEQANDEVNFPGHDLIRFDENIPGLFSTTITLSQAGDQFDFQTQTSDSALGIDSSITIQGRLPGEAGNYIGLNAVGLRHFQVNAGGKLRLYYLSLREGTTPLNSAGRGGAVVVDSNGKLETNEASFIFNQAVNGGALAFQQGALDSLIQNSSFTSNDASDENSGTHELGQGGAIFADLGTNSIIIENTDFSINFADANGGAIYINRPFEILNSNFGRNDATLDGGALYVDEQSEFTISNTLFNLNESANNGGAIYNNATLIKAGSIINSILLQNIAGWNVTNRQSNGLISAGGAIYSSNNINLILHNSIVSDNEDAGLGLADDISAVLSSTSSFNLISVKGDMSGVTHNNNGNLVGTIQHPLDAGITINSQSNPTGLDSDSPAVNSGSDAEAIAAGLVYDYDGNDRFVGPAVDRGAFESDVLFYNGFESMEL